MGETARRRTKQIAFNTLHGITPRGIVKGVSDVMEGARSEVPGSDRKKRGQGAGARGAAAATANEAAEATNVVDLRPEQIVRRIKQLEAEMFRKARNLEFEAAAGLRDQIERLKRAELGLSGTLTG